MRRSRCGAIVLTGILVPTQVLLALAPSAGAQPLDILSGKRLPGQDTVATSGDAGPESVVSVSAEWSAPRGERPAMVSITAIITPPWYTYSTTQAPVAAMPTRVTVDDSPDYRLAGEFRPDRPPAIHRELGEAFETYESQVSWQAPLDIAPTADLQKLKISGHVRLQVCKKGTCLQPTSFPFTAVLAAADPAAAGEGAGVFAPPNIHATIRGQLEPRTVTPGSSANLVLTAEPAEGWHMSALAPRDNGELGYKPTLIALTNSSGFQLQPTKASSNPIETPSETPGLPPLRYHAARVVWTTPITIPKDTKPGKYTIAGLIGYQTCQDTRCDLPRGARFEGTLTVGATTTPGSVGLTFADAKYGEAAKAAAARPQNAGIEAPAVVGSTDLSSLPMMLLASLVGGFILNFMPCVLPVIGLKILSFAEQAGRSRAQILILNVWYALGTLSVFMVLATLATATNLGLRDENLGWGEQFTSPSFTITMVAIVFVMALSFLSVWEIPIPGFVGSGVAGEVAAREGAVGAFAKGALTTVLSTPCSGPLLGAVFGYTLNQPPLVTYSIFGCIGLGMASPYLLIGAFPHLIRFLPKPGAWMDTFKQMMGFVMLGTIVFLLSLLKSDYFVPTFAMMVGLWAACWWIGRTSLVEPLPRKLKAWAQGAAFAAVVGYCAFTWLVPHPSIIPWKPFSQAELARLRGEGRTVLIDFTANWCATCKWNLFSAIETEAVREMIERNKVVPLLADWSEESPEIKDMLASLQSASIPLLAIFPPGKQPIVLRDLIAKQAVLDALQEAGPSQAESKPLAASLPPGP